MATPVLDLDTLTVRPTVKIDGTPYPLRSAEDFSVVEYHQHKRELPRFAELLNQEALSDAEGAELVALLGSYTRRVFAAPPEIHAKLTDGQRLQIVTVFSQLSGPNGPRLGAPTLRPTSSGTIGASSSPASPDSSAEIH